MMRAGIRSFWVSIDRDIPHVKVIEFAPIAVAARAQPRADGAGRPGDAIPAGNGRKPLCAAGLYARGAVGRCPPAGGRSRAGDGSGPGRRPAMIGRILPYPPLSVLLLALWLMLNQSVSLGHLILGFDPGHRRADRLRPARRAADADAPAAGHAAALRHRAVRTRALQSGGGAGDSRATAPAHLRLRAHPARHALALRPCRRWRSS